MPSHQKASVPDCQVVIADFDLLCPSAPSHPVKETQVVERNGKKYSVKKNVYTTNKDGKKIPKLRKGFHGVSKDGKVSSYQGRLTKSRILDLIREVAAEEYMTQWKEYHGNRVDASPPKQPKVSLSFLHIMMVALKADASATIYYADAHRQRSGGKRKTLNAGDVESADISNPIVRHGVGVKGLLD